MELNNFWPALKKIIEIIRTKIIRIVLQIKLYFKKGLRYFQSSEAIFLLFFSTLIGIGAGFGAILFRWMIAVFQNIFFTQGQHTLSFLGSYYVIIIPAIGGIIVGVLVYFFAREAKGHGVPEVMLAVAVSGSRIRPRVAAVKALVSSICIGSGGSVGREGPIVQISSALGSTIGQVFRLSEDKRRILIACGAAGGIAATFNAPLAGIFFGLEIILREYGTRYFSSVVLTSVTATVISRTFLGSNPAFITPAYELLNSYDIFFYMILGFLAAIVGWLFIKLLYKCEDLFDIIKMPEYLKPALGGLILGLIGLYFPQIFGVGYPSIEKTLHGQLGPVIVFSLLGLKIIATSLTLGSGGSGGVFAPSLFIGAMLGSTFGSFLHLIFPAMAVSTGAFALVGMAAVFAGAAQAPISAIVILFEMTGDYKILLPLLVACVISTLCLKWFSKDSIYTLKLSRRGIDITKVKSADLMDMIKVSDAMDRKVITITDSTSVINADQIMRSTSHKGFPVLNKNGQLKGIVTQKDIDGALKNGNSDIPILQIMTVDIICCFPEESLKEALEKFGEYNIGRIPVVEPNDREKMIGIITRKNIIEAYNKALNSESDKSLVKTG